MCHSTHSRGRHRNLRRPHCRWRSHSHKSRSRSPCRRRSRNRHRRWIGHRRRSRIQPVTVYRAVRTPARHRPGHVLVSRKFLLSNSRRPRVTRLIRVQSRQSRNYRHRWRGGTTTARDPAARNQRHQSKPQAKPCDPSVETRLAASRSPQPHNSHQCHPSQCEERQSGRTPGSVETAVPGRPRFARVGTGALASLP